MRMTEMLERVAEEFVREGAVRGEAKALTLVLERRFGSLAAYTLRQIDEAESWLLESWLGQVVDGATLEEMFGPEPEVADEDSGLSQAAKDLLAEGEVKGKAAALHLMLQRRFGRLPEQVLTRIHEAGPEQLETWLARAAEGTTLEAVLGREGRML